MSHNDNLNILIVVIFRCFIFIIYENKFCILILIKLFFYKLWPQVQFFYIHIIGFFQIFILRII